MAADDAGNRRWGVWLVALSAGLTLAACGAAGRTGGAIGTSSSPTPSPVVPSASPTPSGPVTLGTLAALAERAAIASGDPSVRVADAVLTTRQAANTVTSGSLVNSNESVYLVQLQGHFTANDVPLPLGDTQAPTGTDLIIVVDVSDGFVRDTGLMHKAADLSSLGPVIVLTL